MTDLWHPRAVQVRAPTTSWGTYTGGPFRGVLHTTETDNYPPSTQSYYGHNYWPHATIGLDAQGQWRIWQHIPINRAARALQNPAGGVQTNNQSAVQCEIVWRAGKAPQMPKALMDGVQSWMRWVEEAVGVKRRAVAFYGPDCGWTLASAAARQRMAPAAWNAFDGWCGHQHVPENSHWDPGAIDIRTLLSGAGTDPGPAPAPTPVPSKEDDMSVIVYPKGGGPSYLLLDGKKLELTRWEGSGGVLEAIRDGALFLEANAEQLKAIPTP